ncbi:MAG: siphovirus Gp157 family protein [Xanthobacteraceae bacterium]
MDQTLANDIRIAEAVISLMQISGVGLDDPHFGELFDAECDLQERLRRMLRAARETEAQSKALAGIITEMRTRKERLDAKTSGLREAVSYAMQEAGLKTLPAPDFTASLSAGKPKLIGLDSIDPAHLPDTCCRIKREPDRVKIREFLEGGLSIEGISFGNPQPVLTVRVK